MCYTKNCYENCISKKFLIPAKFWPEILEITLKMPLKARTGRPSLEFKRGINGGDLFFVKNWHSLECCASLFWVKFSRTSTLSKTHRG